MAAPVLVGSDVQTTTRNLINLPAGTSAGTVLVAFLSFSQPGVVISSPPAGWTQRASITNAGPEYFTHFVFTYVCSGSDPTSWTFNSNSGDAPGACWAYDGVDNTNPWDSGSTDAGGISA